MNFRIFNPDWFWAFLPLFFFVTFLWWKKSYRLAWFSLRRSILISLALASLIFALARPQWGNSDSIKKAVSPSIFLAVDISRSMLVEDISPDRLAYSTVFSNRLVEQLSDPRVALFPFAASGFLLLPFTTDLFAIQESLNSLEPSATSHQGTNFNQLLSDLFQLILRQKHQLAETVEGYQNPIVIILSDGESHVDFDSSTLRPFLDSDIKIFTVAVGTPEGGPVPGERLQNIRSTSQIEPLRTIALKSGGAFFSGDLSNVGPLVQQINLSAQLTQVKSQFKVTRELFSIFVLLSVILFLSDFLLSRWQYVIRLVLLFLLVYPSFDARASEGETQAIETYNKGLQELNNNQTEKAAEYFEESALLFQDVENKKKAFFNLGNSFLKLGDPEQAIESYQKAFRIQSSNANFETEANQRISENMVLASKLLKQMKSQDQASGDQEQGEGNSQQGQDPKGPQKFKGADLSEEQKQKLFDLITSEERDTQRRIRERNKPQPNKEAKPW